MFHFPEATLNRTESTVLTGESMHSLHNRKKQISKSKHIENSLQNHFNASPYPNLGMRDFSFTFCAKTEGVQTLMAYIYQRWQKQVKVPNRYSSTSRNTILKFFT